MNESLYESSLVCDIIRHVPRGAAVEAPCDAELVDFDPGGDSFLAVSADCLCEEITTGLYSDPYTIGWILVMAAASDLAAAGARMLGVTLALNLPESFDRQQRESLGRGIGDACRSLATVTLGGDTGVAKELVVTAFAVGLVSKKHVMTRVGARPGDVLYLSGPVGLGSAYALSCFDPVEGEDPFPFRPRAPLEMGELLRDFASCAMDTSDGVIATLDELSRTNRTGFMIAAEPERFLDPRALEACRCRDIPPWAALAGCHGEFALAFTIPGAVEERFLSAARQGGLTPKRAGLVTDEPGVFLGWEDAPGKIDSAWIRNLRGGQTSDVQTYIRSLIKYAHSLRK